MTAGAPGPRAGRFVANVLLLGGLLLVAIVGVLFFVLPGLLVFEDESPSRDDEHGYEEGERRSTYVRRRVVGGGEPGWPSDPPDPAEVAPGSAPGPIVLRGRVEGPGGEPLAGVAVRVAGDWYRTGDDGRFEGDAPPAYDPVPVHVLAPGHRLAAPLTVAPEAFGEPLVLRLVPDRQVIVRGTVSGDEGRPLPGANVRIAVYRTRGSTDAFSDGFDVEGLNDAVDAVRDAFQPVATTAGDGSYALRVPAVTRHFLVIAWADGHGSEASEPVHVVPDRDGYDVSITLRPDRTLRGRVVDADTLLPVGGATVTTWLSQQGRPGEDAVLTDGNGEFAIEAAQRSNAYVLADGYLRGELSLMPGDAALDVRLVRARSISGIVQHSDGTPVHGAYVKVQSPSRLPRGVNAPRAVVTPEAGTFRFDTVWDAEWTVAAVLTHHAKTNFLSTEVKRVSAGAQDVVVVVRRARAISGRVLGPEGNALAAVYVSCERDGGSGAPGDGAGVHSKRDGTFELRGLSDGSFHVSATVTPPGMPSYLPAHADGVAAGAGGVELRMSLGLSLHGRIVDEEGAPVAGRRVLAIDPETVGLAYDSPREGPTDDDGRFTISGLEERAYRLQLNPLAPEWHRCHLEGGESVRPGNGGLALRLSTGGEITGVVVDDAGSPLADAEVQAAPMEHPSRIESRAVTDPRGRFRIRGLVRTRRYRLHGGGATLDDVAPGARDVRIE